MSTSYQSIRALCLAMLLALLATTAFSAPAGAQAGGPLINNVFLDTDVRQALQDMATQAGVTIVPGPELTGLITAEIKDKPLEEALNIVLAGTGYDWMKKDGYYLVYSPTPDSPVFGRVSETRLVKLAFVRSGQAMDLLPAMYKQYVTADAASDSLMVTAPKRILDNVIAAVKTIDSPARRMPPDPKSAEFLKTSRSKMIRLNHIDAKSAINLVPAVYKPYVAADEASGVLLVTASPEMIGEIEGVLRALDRPRRHVLLDAKVVVLERGDLLNLGVEWGFPTGQAGGFWRDDKWTFGVQVGLTTDFTFTNALNATLNLLQQNQEASIISTPQVVAQDGKSAEIKVTNEEYFQITNTGFVTQLQLEKIATGTILTILPRIGDDGAINIDLTAEVSDVVARASDGLPLVTRRTAQSSVRIKDGGTIAIAGLMDSRNRRTDKGVPGASKVPVLGELFKNRNSSDNNQQIAIFVTARLIPDKPLAFSPGPDKRNIPLVDVEKFREELKEAYTRLCR